MTLRRDAQRNRDRIVAEARTLFASDGVDVPVEEITRHAGVGMGTLYRHFPTKDDLVDAVLEETFDAYVALARDALDEQDAWVGFTSFLEHALTLYAGNRCLMEVVTTSDRGHSRAQATRERIRPLLAQLVERAQAQGRLRADFTAEDVPVVLWALGRVVEVTEGVAPGTWRRYLGLVLDGLPAGAPRSLPRPALTSAQLAAARGRVR